MDAKIQDYNDKLRNGHAYQSAGVKGAFTNNLKPSSNAGSFLLRNQYGQHLEGIGGIPQTLSPPAYTGLSEPSARNITSRMGGGASSGLGAANFRTPQVGSGGVKLDKVNKRLIVNDDKLLQGVQLYTPDHHS